jgi:hypothetical protein
VREGLSERGREESIEELRFGLETLALEIGDLRAVQCQASERLAVLVRRRGRLERHLEALGANPEAGP